MRGVSSIPIALLYPRDEREYFSQDFLLTSINLIILEVDVAVRRNDDAVSTLISVENEPQGVRIPATIQLGNVFCIACQKVGFLYMQRLPRPWRNVGGRLNNGCIIKTKLVV